ncbi:hypothetical protein XSR1_340036 [Xenorhabdus szentirmaii DSM 16338]|uniref:Uncharacterized protein n=1 Tax=Xenorhabdus szentirmaii DSM 16338 TaxID=1427518 RepID=W1J186_9GAMM|nr:hypothetical protein XSR1_340036 [Xenorhabdus szentirmaii DSM 16338]
MRNKIIGIDLASALPA